MKHTHLLWWYQCQSVNDWTLPEHYYCFVFSFFFILSKVDGDPFFIWQNKVAREHNARTHLNNSVYIFFSPSSTCLLVNDFTTTIFFSLNFQHCWRNENHHNFRSGLECFHSKNFKIRLFGVKTVSDYFSLSFAAHLLRFIVLGQQGSDEKIRFFPGD